MSEPSLRLEAGAPGREGTLGGDLARARPRALRLLPARGRAVARPDARPERTDAGGSERGEGGSVSAEHLGASTESARGKLGRILAGEGVLVSTGQQPLLFLGPLYVLYKALTALALARAFEERHGAPALALFWVASDDHDWDEVGRTRLIDTGNRLATISLAPPEGRAGRAVGATPLPDHIDERIDEVSHLLPDSEFRPEYMSLFRDAYRPGTTVGAAFARALAGVLGDRDFAWVDAAEPAVRAAAAPLFRRALSDAAAAGGTLEAAAGRIRAAGYEAQIDRRVDAVPLFLDTDAGRTRIYHDDGTLRLGRNGSKLPADELKEELRRRPGRFSPDVALRPLVESWLFPVAATVLGPSELAYWAQLPGLFSWAGLSMPAVRPRLSWTVVERKIARVLEKTDAEMSAFADGGESLIRAETERGRPATIDAALADLRRSLDTSLEDLATIVGRELPGLRSAVGAARQKGFAALSDLESVIDGRIRERQSVLHRQIRKAALHLFPDGGPQERGLSALYYLSRYGSDFVAMVDRHGRSAADELLADVAGSGRPR